jgi:hypothetical protein
MKLPTLIRTEDILLQHEQYEVSLHRRLIEERAVDATLRFETIMRLYYVRHSYDMSDSLMSYFFTVLATMKFQELAATAPLAHNSETIKFIRATIFLALKGIYHQGVCYHVAKVIYRLMVSQLAPEDLKVLHTFLPEHDRIEDSKVLAEHARSLFVMPGHDINSDPKLSSLKAVVTEFAKTSLKDTDGKDENSSRASSLSAS